MTIKFSYILALLLAIGGCASPDRRAVIAEVGDQKLTEYEVSKALEEMHLDPVDVALRVQYVNRWVDRRILLNEAKRRGYHRNKEIKKRLEAIREEMMINKLLDEAIQIDSPDETEIVAYWRDHTGEFTRPADEVKLIIVFTPDRNIAWGVRNGMDQSMSPEELMAEYEGISFDTTGYLRKDRLPRNMQRSLNRLRTNDPSLPFQVHDQWMIVKLVERASAGNTRSVEEVSDEIRLRLTAEEKNRSELRFLADLRRDARRKGLVRLSIPFDTLEVSAEAEEMAEEIVSDSITIDETAEEVTKEPVAIIQPPARETSTTPGMAADTSSIRAIDVQPSEEVITSRIEPQIEMPVKDMPMMISDTINGSPQTELHPDSEDIGEPDSITFGEGVIDSTETDSVTVDTLITPTLGDTTGVEESE